MGIGGNYIKLCNLQCVLYGCQQADGTSGAQTPMRAAGSYFPLDDILPPLAEYMIDDIGEEWDDEVEMQCPNLRWFLTTKIGFEQFERQPPTRIITPQRYLEVIRNYAFGLCGAYEQIIVAAGDLAWLGEDDYSLNPPAVCSVATR